MNAFTAFRPETYTKLQLNEGIFLENFDYSKVETIDALKTAIASAISAGTGLIGATKGGGTFEATPTLREIEPDGYRGPMIGSTVNDTWTIKLRGTMMEITSANFKRALMSADVTPNTKKTTIKLRNDIKGADYIKSMVWIGKTSKGAVLIDLENVLNTTGATLTFADKGEGTMPFEFLAHAGETGYTEYAPVTIIFLEEATAA